MRSIRLRNFRSFEDTGRIELKPITILVGANSSGKSSFLRFFPLLRQTVEARTESPLLWYADAGFVDFGDFGTAMRRGAQPRELDVEFWMGEPTSSHVVTTLAQEQGATFVRKCVVAARSMCSMTLDSAGFVTSLSDDNLDASLLWGYRPQVTSGHLIPDLPPRSGGVASFAPTSEMLLECRMALDSFAKGIRYIAGARKAPERYYRMQEVAVGEVFPQGENLAMFLWKLPDEAKVAFSTFFREYFGFAVRLEAEGPHVSILLEDARGELFNLIDLGFGFSQVLPYAAQAWATASGYRATNRVSATTMLAVEQPELHLHPRYQAKLGDLLVGVRKATSVPLLVETHSKSLINRLGEHVEGGTISSDDVSVLLFEKDEKTGITSIQRSHFTPDGSLTNWPFGFFAP